MLEELQHVVDEAQNVFTSNSVFCLLIAVLNGKIKAPVQILINSEKCDGIRELHGLNKLTERQIHTPPSPNSLALPPLCWDCPATKNIRQTFRNLSQRATSSG